MTFYFCGRYTNIDAEKKVEWDMFMVVPHFWGSSDHYRYEEWENHLEDFFSYFSLTSEQKYQYAQMRLIGEAYKLLEDSHIDCRYWLVLQNLFRTRYVSHLYASKQTIVSPMLRNQSQKI